MPSVSVCVTRLWVDLLNRYSLRVVDAGTYLAHVVVSSRSVGAVVNHWTHGGIDLHWSVRASFGWESYAVNNLLWRRSSAKSPRPFVGTDDECEYQGLAWKLEEAGADILRGDLSWTREYAKTIDEPTRLVGDASAELDRITDEIQGL